MRSKNEKNNGKGPQKAKEAKKETAQETGVEVGEQLDLINVGPEHSAELNEATTFWKGLVTKRLALQAKEATAKDKALALFKAEKLSRMEDGSIKCRCEGWKLELKPSEEKFTATPIK